MVIVVLVVVGGGGGGKQTNRLASFHATTLLPGRLSLLDWNWLGSSLIERLTQFESYCKPTNWLTGLELA